MIDWRKWIYDTLTGDVDIANAVGGPENIHGAGSLSGPPADKPFIVIRFEQNLPGPFSSVAAQDANVYVHDEPGGYVTIGYILGLVKTAIEQRGFAENVQGVVWQGDSADLADDGYGTIVRSTSYRFNGRK